METKPKPNSGAIARAAKSMEAKGDRKSMQAYVEKMMPQIKKALPAVITPERFTRIVLSAISNNPKLAECNPQSFLSAMMTAAQLGTEVNTPLGQAYLIPRWNSKAGCNEAQFQLGYKGLIDLAYRSGQISTISAHVVYSNDVFEYELGLETKLRHVPAMKDRGEPTHVYATFHTKDGGYGFEVMSMDDVRRHRDQFSEAAKRGNFSPWATNFEEMAKKTVLKRVLKYAPMKTDFVRALSADETVKTTISEDMFSEPVVFVETEAEDTITAEEAVEVMSNNAE